MSEAYVVEEDDYTIITDPSGVGIFYRVTAKVDGRVVGDVVSLPAARELAARYGREVLKY